MVSTIFSACSFIQNRPNICINCKYFTYKHNNTDKANDTKVSDSKVPNAKVTDAKYGKCSYFSKVENNIEYLVSGHSEYEYCYIARKYEDMCGKEGRMYKSLTDDSWDDNWQ
jgi:hypothetical protein